MTRILIIMPALNEEESLPATLKELREVVDDHDILVIDDGSTDATAEVASRAGAVSAQLPFTLGEPNGVRATGTSVKRCKCRKTSFIMNVNHVQPFKL